jgi:D-beta-D-heptose 7-phosphate kinase/D-beta-D-heptose 1-phosphate adenosyltransferase
VVAVLALAIACGLEIEAAAELANLAAGIVVGKIGTVPIHRDELLALLSRSNRTASHTKIVSLVQLRQQLADWRNAGERIVFTNGCFDLLHAGHVTLLESARRMGDRVVVGLNSDHSVSCLKGPGRPLVTQQERARILAAMSAVDAVVIFEEATPLKLIEAVRPDVLVKGADYAENNVVGASEVRAWGGRVELVPLVQGMSSSRLMAKSVAAVAGHPAMSAQAV